ncbi:MAG: thioredoxin family protein [Aggregatilineales bacterium]
MLTIKILGSGCANCKRLEQEVATALTENGFDFKLIKVTDYAEMMAYGILSTPGLVINETLVSAGRIPKREQIVTWAVDFSAAK